MNVTTTYTHVGCRPLLGIRPRGGLYGQRGCRVQTHAITGTDYVTGRSGVTLRHYLTLCGDSYPADDDSADALAPAADQTGTGVTCRKCRAAIRKIQEQP